VKSEIAYANSKGIEVGGYDLIVWTRDDVPEYWHDVGGDGTCIASSWSVVILYVSVCKQLHWRHCNCDHCDR